MRTIPIFFHEKDSAQYVRQVILFTEKVAFPPHQSSSEKILLFSRTIKSVKLPLK
jgi:hypothetical protein